MESHLGAYRGCLLGLAIGDAMGYTVDTKSWDEIQESYGPNGLLGFDLQDEEYPPVSSYTQIAAFMGNALLLSISRSKPDHVGYGKLALKEWTRSQHFYRDPEPSLCWIAKLPYFRRRHCRDARMLDNLRLASFGSVATPKNDNSAPGAITAAVATGMFYHPSRIAPEQVGILSSELICLTHGNPETFLSGVVLAYTIAGILQEPEIPLKDQFLQAIAVMDGQFRSRFYQAEELALQLRRSKAEFTAMRQMQEQARQYRHDLRHHFALLMGFAEEGDLAKLKEYLIQNSENLDRFTPKVYCGNTVVNLLLSHFEEQAAAWGVALEVNAALPESIPFSDSELCSLLSNGLENAIRAAALAHGRERAVSISLQVRQQNLLLSIRNPYEGEITFENGIPQSSRNGHGFGSRSIISIVNEHSGQVSFSANGGIFLLRIMLPMA